MREKKYEGGKVKLLQWLHGYEADLFKGNALVECVFLLFKKRHRNPVFKERRFLNDADGGNRDGEGGDGIMRELHHLLLLNG